MLLLFVGVVSVAIVMLFIKNMKQSLPAFAELDDGITVIVDAGHGGEDGGAVAYDKKTVEKDINLAIALKLKDFLTVGGYKVIMTREDDRLICDDGLNTIKKRKTSDIKNRLKIVEDNPEAIFVSVHQNKFTQSKTSGAQVFFGRKNPESKLLAQEMQDMFRELLQPENGREVKKTGKEIYLLYHSEIPSVMVECGFLSNAEECEMLKLDEYQNKVAFTIYAGLSKYIESCRDRVEETETLQ